MNVDRIMKQIYYNKKKAAAARRILNHRCRQLRKRKSFFARGHFLLRVRDDAVAQHEPLRDGVHDVVVGADERQRVVGKVLRGGLLWADFIDFRAYKKKSCLDKFGA
jgi:hypothetical protein